MNKFPKLSAKATATALLGAILLGSALPALTLAATRPITISVYIGDHCVQGVASDNATVEVTLKDSGGVKKVKRTTTAAANGSFSICNLGGNIVEIGDMLHISDGYSTHDTSVPELTLFQNRDTDVYKGRGPAGEHVRLICGLSNGFEPCAETWNLKVNAQGQWSYKPGWDVRGNENMGLRWKNTDGDAFNVWNTSPFVAVTIGQAGVQGAARAGSPATVVLKKPNFDVRGTAMAVGSAGYGTFNSKFLTAGGTKATVHVGDQVTGDMASDIDFIVHDITANANASTGHVTGNCVPDSLWFISVYRNGVEVDGDDWRFDPDTHFNANFSSLPLMAGDRVLVQCELPTRDIIQKWFTAA